MKHLLLNLSVCFFSTVAVAAYFPDKNWELSSASQENVNELRLQALEDIAFKDPAILFTWQSKMDKVTERLKIEAAKLGANGILIVNTDNKIYQSTSSDGEGSTSSSSYTEKFGKAIAIYVLENE